MLKKIGFQSFAATQWAQAKEVLWTSSSRMGELVQAQDGVVRVFGFEPSQSYIIVGPISNSFGAKTYYILPYAGSHTMVDAAIDTL